MQNIGKTLLFMGGLMIVAGFLLILAGKFGIPLGKLPGDISYHRKNVTVFIPLGTMLLVSVVISLILNLFSRWK